MASMQDYGKMMREYFASQGTGPTQPYFDPQAEVSGYGQAPGYADAFQKYQDYNAKIGQGWLDSLTPQQRSEYDTLHQQEVAAKAKKSRMGALIAFGAPLLAAGAGALAPGIFGGSGGGGMGVLGGGAGSGAGGLGAMGFNAAVDSQLASAAAGITGADAAAAATVPAWASGAAGAGWTGGVPGAISGPGITDIGKTIGKQLLNGNANGNSGGTNWGALLGGGSMGALAAILALQNRGSMPGLPDFTKLAEQTAASQNAAVNAQTLANRPNQTNAMGDTSTWSIGPDGRPVQKTQYSAANQQALDQNNQTLAALRGQMTANAGQPLAAPAMGMAMTNALRTKRVL